jgi:hypothetical protein
VPSLDLDRERVIQALCAQYANDVLSTQELESRFERAYKATTSIELQAVMVGLPALPPEVAGMQRQSDQLYRVTASAAPAEEKRSLALMSSFKKVGDWLPARRNVVWAVMGEAVIDMREAIFPGGTIELHCVAVMGEVKLIVPPGLRIACDGMAIMGEFTEYHSSGDERPDAPLVRITGTAVMGSVTIQTRLPGESRLEAWRRKRLEGGRRKAEG